MGAKNAESNGDKQSPQSEQSLLVDGLLTALGTLTLELRLAANRHREMVTMWSAIVSQNATIIQILAQSDLADDELSTYMDGTPIKNN